MNNQTDLASSYRIHEAIAVREIEGQFLILTPDDDVLYTLNRTGQFIWSLLAKGMIIAQMAARLATEYHISEEKAINDVRHLLCQLEEKHIIEGAH